MSRSTGCPLKTTMASAAGLARIAEPWFLGHTVSVDRMDIDGGTIRSEWTCNSAAFRTPMRGFDLVSIRDGKIARLETTLLSPQEEYAA